MADQDETNRNKRNAKNKKGKGAELNTTLNETEEPRAKDQKNEDGRTTKANRKDDAKNTKPTTTKRKGKDNDEDKKSKDKKNEEEAKLKEKEKENKKEEEKKAKVEEEKNPVAKEKKDDEKNPSTPAKDKKEEEKPKEEAKIDSKAENEDATETVVTLIPTKSKTKVVTIKESPSEDPRLIWVNKTITEKNTVKAYYKQFARQRNWKPEQSSSIAHDKKVNQEKSRYADIVCLDATRVTLKGRPSEQDFIHANWIVMPDGFRYISTQGPLDETIVDFWQMIFTERCPVIVMICGFVENQLSKSAVYIPMDKPQEKYGPFKVKKLPVKEKEIEDVKIRAFEVTKEGESYKHIVYQYHYQNWADHLAPTSPTSIVKLYRICREKGSKDAPVVVHCSAGVGRTATFIGVDYGIQRIKQDPNIGPFDLIRDMRRMRYKAVQTYYQYVFLILCILEVFVEDGVVQRSDLMKAFTEEYIKRMDLDKKDKEREKKKAAGKDKEKDKKDE